MSGQVTQYFLEMEAVIGQKLFQKKIYVLFCVNTKYLCELRKLKPCSISLFLSILRALEQLQAVTVQDMPNIVVELKKAQSYKYNSS